MSALSPDAGETTSQQYEGFAPTPDFVIEVGDDGFGFLDRDTFKAGFAADLSDADAAFLRDSQVPIDMSVFGAALTHAAWRDKPSWAVIGTDDRAFDQAMLQHMATRIGARITDVAASHALYISQSASSPTSSPPRPRTLRSASAEAPLESHRRAGSHRVTRAGPPVVRRRTRCLADQIVERPDLAAVMIRANPQPTAETRGTLTMTIATRFGRNLSPSGPPT